MILSSILENLLLPTKRALVGTEYAVVSPNLSSLILLKANEFGNLWCISPISGGRVRALIKYVLLAISLVIRVPTVITALF